MKLHVVSVIQLLQQVKLKINLNFFFPENDGIFSFGLNESGQLGLGKNSKDNQSTPQQITFFNKMKIKQISCGDYHTLVLTGKKLNYIS